MDEILRFLRAAPPHRPRQGREDFIKNKEIIPGERPRSRTRVKYKHRLLEYEMDDELSEILKMPMEDALEQQRFQIELNADEYDEFFSNLLFAEEFYIREGLKMYDRQGVTMEEDNEYEGFVKLIMYGLAEKRPSVLPGDHILAVICGDMGKAYQGFVHKIRTNSIVLKFGRVFLQEVDLSRARFNIRFTFNRVSMRRMHQALNNPKVDFHRLFPQNHQRSPANEARIETINRNINFHSLQNTHQRRAVAIIKSGIHHPWPFIVFGPPGTGKSTTIVEAMCRLLDDKTTTTRILACAASNAAANWLLKKLSEHLSDKVVIRVNAVSQNPERLDPELHCYCVINNGKYQFPTLTYIETFQVVVTTCITAGAVYALGGEKPYTHIFVDEAGQALEPEILTALQNASKDTRVILAGDPKQLGPLVRSPIAREFDLGISLIERLATSRFYDFCDTCIYGVKLRMNYRSHPDILSYPNAKFYGNELIPCANESITHSLIGFSYLRTPDYPLMFWSVKDGKEVQEGQSPSFFNAHEAGYVLAVVKQLLREGVKEEDIGVVTPYIKQVEKIKKLLTRKDVHNVEIGTVEKFQGQERRVIIISTVRSDSLGFIGDPRRFCVAVTRAQALFVVIGDEKILYSSGLWGQWLDEVKSNGGYSTRDFPDNVWHDP